MMNSTVKMLRYLLPIALLALAALPASAGLSDFFQLIDPQGNVIEFDLTKDLESGQIIFYIPDPTLADPMQYGNATTLYQPGFDPQDPNGWSDIFGVILLDDGNYYLAFSSDPNDETPDIYGGQGAIFIVEDHDMSNPYDATMYLNPALQAQGFRATFWSDPDN